jgi:CAAX protease family protein
MLVLVVVGAGAIRGWLRADHLRDLANLDRIRLYESTMVFEWLLLGFVLLGVWLQGASPLEVLGERWRSIQQFLRDAGIGLLFLLVTIIFTSMVGGHGGKDDATTHFLLPQGRTEMLFWIAVSVTAGICEEAVYRGYLQKQFIALTKSVPAGIVLSGLLFGAAHSYQGFTKASVIGVMGAAGGILAYWRRSVRPGMIAHALQDILGGFVGR